MEEVMIDHIIKPHVTLRPTERAKAPPEHRILGDSSALNEAGAEIRHEGDGEWRNETPVEPAPFLQAMAQWKMEGPSGTGARPLPLRDENPSSLD
jgi:hypothetical protein